MSKTRRDVVSQALANLGVLAAGQSPSAEDFTTVDGHVDSVKDALRQRDIVDIDFSNLPDGYFMPLAALVADSAANEFGLPSNPARVLGAETAFRQMTYNRPSRLPLQVDYF